MKISVEKARELHKKLREILIKYGNKEYGDCIVDEISWLFNFPTTIDTEPEGEFLSTREYELAGYHFKTFNTDEGFTNIEVKDCFGEFVDIIAGVEFPDELDTYEVLNFEALLRTWLKGKGLC